MSFYSILQDFTGDWIKTDSIITITVPYWGGIARYKWKIVSMNEFELKIAIISENFQIKD